MDLGVIFPQLEIGTDPTVIREYAETVEELGFQHLLCFDHVLGVNADREGGWGGPYDHHDQFHEPLSLFSFLAGVTDSIELVTGVLVLPQRQTALVAKQAAEVDVLSGGRLRLGVAVGWNPLEYVALGQPFEERGRRIEEQIEVLRSLWTEPVVQFEGEYHELRDVGINPLPVQRPIPLWMGGTADVVLRRVGRTADGWIPQFQPGEEAEAMLARLQAYAEEAGRDPDEVGVHGRFTLEPGSPDGWIDRVRAWEDLGVDHLGIDTMGHGRDPEEHVRALQAFAEEMQNAGITIEE